jgi:hypothetical protein
LRHRYHKHRLDSLHLWYRGHDSAGVDGLMGAVGATGYAVSRISVSKSKRSGDWLMSILQHAKKAIDLAEARKNGRNYFSLRCWDNHIESNSWKTTGIPLERRTHWFHGPGGPAILFAAFNQPFPWLLGQQYTPHKEGFSGGHQFHL